VDNKTVQDNYIKQVKVLVAGLNQAGKEQDMELLIKYENIVEELLISLQGKTIPVALRVELNKLKAQHAKTQEDVAEMIESVKKNLEKFKKSKKRMSAYSDHSTTHINIKA